VSCGRGDDADEGDEAVQNGEHRRGGKKGKGKKGMKKDYSRGVEDFGFQAWDARWTGFDRQLMWDANAVARDRATLIAYRDHERRQRLRPGSVLRG
jgi:hypothetical protein